MTMTSQSLFKAFKCMIIFIILMNAHCIQNLMASGAVSKFTCEAMGCTEMPTGCSCSPEATPPPNVVAADIFKYAQTGSHPVWKVIRKPEKALVPRHVGEVTVGKIVNRGDGSFIVNYTVRGTPQQAIIQHK
jgi:hypothetical protein